MDKASMDANRDGPIRTRPRRTLISIVLLLTLLTTFGVMVFARRHVSPRVKNTPSKNIPSNGIGKEAAKLVPNESTRPTLFARAMTIRNAIRQGHFGKSENELETVLKESRIGPWSFQPFSWFINRVTAPSNSSFANRLNAWVSIKRESAIAHLARANYYYVLAWRVRGNGFATDVRSKNMHNFQVDIDVAEHEILTTLKLDQGDLYAWGLALKILRDAEGNTAQQAAFRAAIRKFPNYYQLYVIRLGALQPKWYGAISAMYSFVDKYAGHAPDGSPLKMLYLRMYVDLLNAASISCGDLENSAMHRCVEVAMGEIATKQIDAAAYADLKLYNLSDKLQFSQEIGDILTQMIETRGAGRFSGVFLQLAANALGSDTQLVTSGAGKNNYKIDQLASLVWYRRGRYANAEALDMRALTDLRNMHFQNVNANNATRATIYNDLASIYNREGNYHEVVVYEKAVSDLLGGDGATPGFNGIECAPLFNLKRYKEAVRVCSAIIENSGDLQSHFWLARVYDALGKNNSALREYRLIASSQSSFSVDAAMGISLIYDREQQWREALNALNAYPFLFNKARESRYHLAVNYNNRCYDKMKLVDLKGALNDCTR